MGASAISDVGDVDRLTGNKKLAGFRFGGSGHEALVSSFNLWWLPVVMG